LGGIYIHIPFCKQACHYCDFHFSTNLKLKEELLACIIEEGKMQEDYLGGEKVETIYFGGGTPSLLSSEEIYQLLQMIRTCYQVSPFAEITIECNPDDIGEKTIQTFKDNGINRISLGVQTFQDQQLKFLNRVHHAADAIESIHRIQDGPIENYSIDLIYAIPSKDHSLWHNDLSTALSFKPPHISSYCLTIEEQTVFGKWVKQKKLLPIDEDYAAGQYEYLMEQLEISKYDHYEISNFALPGYHSRHNVNYWNLSKYLGLGPGAHSFNGQNRQYNKESNPAFIKSIREGKVPFTMLSTSKKDLVNEYILTSLRTKWGCSLEYLKIHFKIDLPSLAKKKLEFFIGNEYLKIDDNHLILNKKGKLFADKIASDLFI